MSGTLNKVMLIGHLGDEVKLRYFDNGGCIGRFPLATNEINKIIDSYPNADDLVWAQEEPRNMGAYGFLLMNLEQVKQFRVASRRPYGAPAAGSSVRAKKRHQEVIDYVFDATKNNQRN